MKKSNEEILQEARIMMTRAEQSRNGRTPMTEAVSIVATRLPQHLVPDGDEGRVKEASTYLLRELYFPLLELEDFCEQDIDDVVAEAHKIGAVFDLVEKVVGYCVLGVKEYHAGHLDAGWSFIADANYWTGIIAIVGREREPIRHGAMLAHMRHKQTRAEREKVAEYWRSSVDPKLSAQKAADAILMAGITDLSHKKIAEIVSPLRKAEALRKQ